MDLGCITSFMDKIQKAADGFNFGNFLKPTCNMSIIHKVGLCRMMLQIYLMRFCIISDDVDSEVAHPDEVIAETCGLLDKPHMVGRHPLT